MRSAAAGEIVEVQGGHILRSLGRKDRHSKVCTAKGPRDRRVRLAANTAIQFYDVQDRLGYDRPSKAVDWLIKNAQAAINELAALPAWHPSAENSSDVPVPHHEPPVFSFAGGGGGNVSPSFLPPSLVSDTIADTIWSFFPVNSVSALANSTADCSPCFSPELLSHKTHRSEDLRLSLQSIQDTAFDQSNAMQHHPFAFDTSFAVFAEHNQRIVSWNVASNGAGNGTADYAFNMAPILFGNGQVSTQRESLQSSNTSLFRQWIDPVDQRMDQALIPAVSSAGFGSDGPGFTGFHIAERIPGEEELNGISGKPSSASSSSHHP